MIDTVPAVRDRPDAVDPRRLRGLVEFNSVSFSYDGKRPAVADLSFTALPGERVALVGPTGSGKSTALALLHRTFDPQGGVISVDGMDIRALTLTGLRRNIGVVFQETLLFNRSIAENLRVGKPDATEADMRAAAARAQALDFIERNPEGFNAPIGERGRLLSGGERQRLAIARALLKDPPILILDEATSALDPVTEARVTTALDEVMKGRTTFVIAHRLATIRNATRILVFDNGRIIEAGTYDELVQRGGFFADLVKAQFGAEDVRRRHEKDGRQSRRSPDRANGRPAVAGPMTGPRNPETFAARAPLPGFAALNPGYKSAQPLEDADVVGDGGAAHVENAAELGAFDLHVAGAVGELHRGDGMHRHAGGADRMALGFEAAGRIDRQLAVFVDDTVLDGARALALRRKPDRLVDQEFGDGETVMHLGERHVGELDAGLLQSALPGERRAFELENVAARHRQIVLHMLRGAKHDRLVHVKAVSTSVSTTAAAPSETSEQSVRLSGPATRGFFSLSWRQKS